jgi:integrase
MATLRKRLLKKGPVWYIDFWFKGRRYVMSTKTSIRRIAVQILQEIQGKIARGTFNLEDYEKKEIMLSDFLDRYFQYAASYKAKGTITLEKIITSTFSSIVGNCQLRTIDIQTLDRWKAERMNAPINAVTFNIERRALHAIFNVAKKWDYVSENPFREVKKLRVEEHRLFMTNEEQMKFFEALADGIKNASRIPRRKKLQLAFLYYEFLLNTGLRREEGLNLKRSNVDLVQNVIYIEKAKDKETRTVPLTQRATRILESLDEKLFSSLSKDYVTRQFAKHLKDAGLRGFKLHSLRHTTATMMIGHGVDILTVSKILGHSDIRTTMIYAKTQLPVMKRAMEKLETGMIDSYKLVT